MTLRCRLLLFAFLLVLSVNTFAVDMGDYISDSAAMSACEIHNEASFPYAYTHPTGGLQAPLPCHNDGYSTNHVGYEVRPGPWVANVNPPAYLFYTVSSCPSGQSTDFSGKCTEGGKDYGKPVCAAGNPIDITNGNKYQLETDYRAASVFPLAVSRSYNSKTKSWRFFPEIKEVSSETNMLVIRADGKELPFTNNDGEWGTDPDVVGTLTSTEDGLGNITGWSYTARDDRIETYNSLGRILSVTERSGLSHTYSYQTDSITVTHSNGDTLVYQLDSEGRVSGFADPDNKSYQYSYDSEGRLISITFPDATPSYTADNPQRFYHYEKTNYPYALTGITDENGNRFATWGYDVHGRAISSEHANGVGKTTLASSIDGTTTVTNPLGKQTTYRFTTIHGVKKVTQVEGHPTTSCEGANKSYSYDANGNVSSKTDWNGVTTTYTYDMDRNLELTRTEAAGTPQERTITTEWHADFRLPTKIIEPGKITEYTYDAQGRQLSSRASSIQ